MLNRQAAETAAAAAVREGSATPDGRPGTPGSLHPSMQYQASQAQQHQVYAVELPAGIGGTGTGEPAVELSGMSAPAGRKGVASPTNSAPAPSSSVPTGPQVQENIIMPVMEAWKPLAQTAAEPPPPPPPPPKDYVPTSPIGKDPAFALTSASGKGLGVMGREKERGEKGRAPKSKFGGSVGSVGEEQRAEGNSNRF
jgi:hypothetical protein